MSYSNDGCIQLIHYTKRDKVNTYKALGISRQTWWAQKGNTYPSTWVVDDEDFVAYLSFDVFDRLLSWLNTKTTKSREPYLRLYCYIYFNDAKYFHHFQRSQEQMAIDLGMARSWVSCALSELIFEGFIERRGKYKFSGDQIFSYIHSIPDEDRTDARKM